MTGNQEPLFLGENVGGTAGMQKRTPDILMMYSFFPLRSSTDFRVEKRARDRRLVKSL